MENDGTVEQVREIYERAIANVPPSQEKRLWRRYIYIWINYALYEELETQVGVVNALLIGTVYVPRLPVIHVTV